jgi:hypothetical protein
VNTTNSKDIPYVFSWTLALPYGLAGIVILLVFSIGLYTDRGDLAVLTGLVSSTLFYVIIYTADPSNANNGLLLLLIGAFAVLIIPAMLEEQHRKGGGSEGDSEGGRGRGGKGGEHSPAFYKQVKEYRYH